jgi:hypothetical protein
MRRARQGPDGLAGGSDRGRNLDCAQHHRPARHPGRRQQFAEFFWASMICSSRPSFCHNRVTSRSNASNRRERRYGQSYRGHRGPDRRPKFAISSPLPVTNVCNYLSFLDFYRQRRGIYTRACPGERGAGHTVRLPGDRSYRPSGERGERAAVPWFAPWFAPLRARAREGIKGLPHASKAV